MTVKDALLLSLLGQVDGQDGAALVDGVSTAWLHIVRKFAPLIGPTSVLLLFGRTLEHNLAAFAWLPAPALPGAPELAVEQLRTSMAARPAADILAAHRALLATFIDLMTTLIGARLTVQFLRAALPGGGAGGTTEHH